MAISWFPPDKNPPCCTSSTLITAGLYCSKKGTENKSFTFSTTTPIVCVCPTFRDRLRGSNRICAAFVAPGTVVAAPNEVGTVGDVPGAEGTVAAPGAGIQWPQIRARPFRHANDVGRQYDQDLVIFALVLVLGEEIPQERYVRQPRPSVKRLRIGSCYQTGE